MFYIAIVGRPNVGKSTLFNKIVGGRPAIVDDTPGVTRDRNAATSEWFGRKFGVIDSGGFEPTAKEGFLAQMREQTLMAIEEANTIFFMVDGREGITPTDEEIGRILRKSEKKVRLVVNKIDTPATDDGCADFAKLGFSMVHPVSSEHSLGLDDLLEAELAELPIEGNEPTEDEEHPVRIAIVGKPNVGKSSIINKVLNQSRMMVSDVAGTTRDAIDTAVIRNDREYTLIDTAGIRRKGKVTQRLEKYSVIMAMKALERADVALLVIDAEEGIAAQEAKIAGLIEEAGCACIIVVNKWDVVDKETGTAEKYEDSIRRKLKFLPYAPVIFVSAVTGQRIERVFQVVDRVYEQYTKRISTSKLNTIVEAMVAAKSPPSHGSRHLKFYFATQTRVAPPSFVFMTNHPEGLHFSYRRYLVNQLRERGEFDETPIRLMFRKPAGRRSGQARES